jgi:drug/metabolite transporter (DMT)-like permease
MKYDTLLIVFLFFERLKNDSYYEILFNINYYDNQLFTMWGLMLVKKSLLADTSLLFVAFIWGATFVLVQNAISILDPFSFNAVRFFLAAIFLFFCLPLMKQRREAKIHKSLLFAGIIMGVMLFSGYALQTFGLLYTTSSKTGFITGLSVVLVPAFAFLFFKQKLKPNGILGVIAATIGLYFLTMSGEVNVNKGDVLVFFCAISFALHIILTGIYTAKFPSLPLTLVQISTVAVLSGCSAFLFEDWTKMFQSSVILNTKVITALLITSLLATAFAFFVQTMFQKYTTPTRVALIFAMEPVFAAITAYYWADERLSNHALVGCVLIFIGMILTELPVKRKIRNETISAAK